MTKESTFYWNECSPHLSRIRICDYNIFEKIIGSSNAVKRKNKKGSVVKTGWFEKKTKVNGEVKFKFGQSEGY